MVNTLVMFCPTLKLFFIVFCFAIRFVCKRGLLLKFGFGLVSVQSSYFSSKGVLVGLRFLYSLLILKIERFFKFGKSCRKFYIL